MESLSGRLLVANPQLMEPTFARTVVFVVAHTEEGALGVVINRPSEIGVGEAVPALGPLAGPGDVVHAGGPVEPEGLIVMVQWVDPGPDTEMVFGDDIGLLAADHERDGLERWIHWARVYAGHAGWAAGQLEGEIAAGGWFVLEAERADLCSQHPEGLWSEVLRRQGGQLALVARMPTDLSVN